MRPARAGPDVLDHRFHSRRQMVVKQCAEVNQRPRVVYLVLQGGGLVRKRARWNNRHLHACTLCFRLRYRPTARSQCVCRRGIPIKEFFLKRDGTGDEQLTDVLVELVRLRAEPLADGARQREKSVESVVLPGIVRITQYALFGRKDVHSLPPRIKSARPCRQKPHEPRRGGSKPLASEQVKIVGESLRISFTLR